MAQKYNDSTLLSAITIPFFSVILEEVFLIPPHLDLNNPLYPQNLRDLANISFLKTDDVIRRLNYLEQMAIKVTSFNLHKEKGGLHEEILLSLDGTLPDGHQNQVRILDSKHFDTLMDSLKNAKAIVIISQDTKKAFSAAMYLRDLGFPAFLPGSS